MSTETPHSTGHTGFFLVIASAFLFVATTMTFINAVNAEFVNWDDDVYVTENPLVHSLSAENVKRIVSGSYYYAWIPVTLISHAIDVAVWGLSPKGHHLTSVLIHAINAVLFFFVIVSLIDASRAPDGRSFVDRISSSLLVGGTIGALLFAMHPLRTESVAWVSGRKDLLCAQFLLLSLWTYIIWKRNRSHKFLGGSVLFFVLALLSKSSVVAFPIVLILVDVWILKQNQDRSGPLQLRELLVDKIGFFVASVCVTFLMFSIPSGGNVNVLAQLGNLEKILLPFYTLTFYLIKLVIPLDLSPIYPDMDKALLFLSPAIIILLFVVAYQMVKRKMPGLLLALIAFVLFLLPVFLGISSGLQLLSDRYTYISTLSIFILIGAGIDLFWRASAASGGKTYQRELLAIVLLILCAVSSYRTIRHVSIWHDPVSLWEQAIRYAPHDVAEYNERRPYMKPDYLDAMLNLGVAYHSRSESERALAQFRRVLDFDSCNADAYFNIGTVQYGQAQVASALTSFQQAIQCDPLYSKAFFNLGILYASMDSVGLALHSFQSAARLGYSEAQRVLLERGYTW